MSTKTIGGIKGEALEQSLQDIHTECSNAVKAFISEEYDPLDISNDTFNDKYATITEEKITLATVITSKALISQCILIM